jgi:hypothetical protein
MNLTIPFDFFKFSLFLTFWDHIRQQGLGKVTIGSKISFSIVILNKNKEKILS